MAVFYTGLLLAFTLVLLSYYHVSGFEGCSIRFGRRGCHHKSLFGVLVSCDGLGSEPSVPQNLPQDTIYVSLTNFNFSQLHRVNFTRFRTVECLSIIESGITGIDYDTFADMEVLSELVLTATRMNAKDLRFANHPLFKGTLLTLTNSGSIDRVDLNASGNLHHLKTLNLNGNGITKVSSRIFSELENLETLDLGQNLLHDMDWKHFKELESLNHLNLQGNRLQTIPDTMFSVFYAVKALQLSNNKFHCNCNLKWLREFYDQAIDKDMDYESVACASPVAKQMKHFPARKFVCQRPSKPTIYFEKLDSTRYILNCSSSGDPAPTLTLSLPDGRKVISPPSEDLSVLQTVTPEILTQGGNVTCTANNSEGDTGHVESLPLPEGHNHSRQLSATASLLVIAILRALQMLT